MDEKITIDLDKNFLTDFYKLASEPMPEISAINIDNLHTVLGKIEKNIKSESKNISSDLFDKNNSEDNFEEDCDLKPIFIIDDLGVITYQLSVLLKKNHFNPITSKEVFDAISKFKKVNFEIVVMDLFIPTEREGLLLLDELMKISKQKGIEPNIIVMSASIKKEHKKQCLQKGAKFFIEKKDNWQNKLLELCKSF